MKYSILYGILCAGGFFCIELVQISAFNEVNALLISYVLFSFMTPYLS